MKNNKILRNILELVLIFGFVFLLRIFLFNPVEVLGTSMEPTYHESDRLWQMTFVEPSRFDNITFISPRNGKTLVKRVIGLPGDSIRMENDRLYINNQAYDEPYLDEFRQELAEGEQLTNDFSLETLDAVQTTTVPDGKYFVLGDNRQVADDSRYFGFVDQEEVKGVIFFRFFPLDKIGVQ